MIFVELHVPDFEKAKEFYSKLGFSVAWENKPKGYKGYLVMKRNNDVICFWAGNEFVWKQPYFKKFPKNTKRGYGVEIVVMVSNIRKFYSKAKKFANVVEKLKKQPWGDMDFRIEDPFGFYLRFTEPYDVLDPSGAVK